MIKELVAMLMLLSVSFAWSAGFTPPSCIQQYNILGVNFTLTTSEQSIPCAGLNSMFFGFRHTIGEANQLYPGYSEYNSTAITLVKSPSGPYGMLYNTTMPISGNYIITGTGSIYVYCDANATHVTPPITMIDYNATTYKINNSGTSIYCLKSQNLFAYASTEGGALYYPIYNMSTSTEMYFPATIGNTWIGNTSYYLSYLNGEILRSDFKNNTNMIINNSNISSYCRTLLYFNNPYYGNIQLIPKITYIPGVNAFPNFYNTSDNSAYIPNNTLSYVFDGVTSTWYIIPAYTCSSYSIIGSTSTLQYNPTANQGVVGGSVPIDLSSISGSCVYNSIPMVLTCTGSDTSLTLTSLNLSVYSSNSSTLE